MKKMVLLLGLLFLISCVNVDMTPKVNLSKNNLSIDSKNNLSVSNQSLNLTSAQNVTNQSITDSKSNVSLNISSVNNVSVNITNTTKVEKPETKLTSADFEIYFPKEGYRAKGDLIAVSLKLTNFSIGVLGNAEKSNVGLFRYTIDNSGVYKIQDKATFTVSNLTKGKHTLTVEMIGTNMTLLGVKRSVTFNAQTVTEGY